MFTCIYCIYLHFVVVLPALHIHSIWCKLILCGFTFTTSVITLVCLSCATGIWLTLNNTNYTNNSVVTITDIGTGSAALICTTTYRPCCFSGPPPGTHWYFPNGSRINNTNTLPYYRSRTDGKFTLGRVGTVNLHRNPEATTTGVFRCEILDTTGVFQSIYVGIYDAYTGESCTLKNTTSV